MDAARREKKEHGTLAFPFQIYPALDGSEADDSDFIPYHWHPELEIITVDAGHVSLTIADHTYEGTPRDGCDSAPAFAPVNPGRTKSVRCSHRLCGRGRCRRPAVSWP